jgi:hypothetical protein
MTSAYCKVGGKLNFCVNFGTVIPNLDAEILRCATVIIFVMHNLMNVSDCWRNWRAEAVSCMEM